MLRPTIIDPRVRENKFVVIKEIQRDKRARKGLQHILNGNKTHTIWSNKTNHK